jgi:uncharacterized phiE125 gp8 family phage protein
LYKLTQAPTVQCIDSDSLKLYLRIDDASATEEDDLLNDLIWSAIYQAQDYCGVAFNTQKYSYRCLPTNGYITLPWTPLASVQTVSGVYQGTKTTISSDSYVVDTVSTPGQIMLKAGQAWPALIDYVEVEYTAGYGSKSTDVPAPIRNAVKIIAASQYDDRSNPSIPDAAKRLLGPFRMDDEDFTLNWR